MSHSDPSGPLSEPGIETAPEAPSVVAVIVTHNPGPWFEETLSAFVAQDYPNLAILVLDAASAVDPLSRIARIAPSAFVRRLSHNPGFAAACNRATRIVHGATFLLFCHDDIVPAPNAVRVMVERALRSNASVVTPKYVTWDDPNRLLGLGGTVDATGAFIPGVESGDRDQGQHDKAEETFVAPGGAMLTRADLFLTLGGFDGAMTFTGEDVDYSWRVQLAGARIVTEPQARVRHIEAASHDLRLLGSTVSASDDEEIESEAFPPSLDGLLLRRRHRLRTILKVRGRLNFWRALVRLMAISLVEGIGGMVTGRGEHTAAVASAWIWNAAHWRDLFQLRRHAQRERKVKDKKLDARLAPVRDRVERLAREEYERRREAFLAEGGGIVGRLRRLPVVVWIAVLTIWLLGSRRLLFERLPTIGTIVPLPSGPIETFQRFFGVIPAEPFGQMVNRSPIDLIIGLLGVIFVSAMGTLQQFIVLGMLPIGIWGMIRLVRPLRSSYAKLAAVIGYVAIPIPYDALSMGRWSALVCYAIAPFVLLRMLRSLDAPPYRRPRRHFDLELSRRRLREELDELELIDVTQPAAGNTTSMNAVKTESVRDADVAQKKESVVRAERVLPMALLFGLAASVVPQVLVAALLVAAALGIASLLTRDKDADVKRIIVLTFVACALALLLVLPALLGADRGFARLWQAPILTYVPTQLKELLAFSTGITSASYLTYGIIIGGLPGLFFGRKWRYQLSVRLWFVTLFCIAAQWFGASIEGFRPNPSVFVTFAAVAAVANIAVGVSAIREDLSTYRFGWRHLFPLLTVIGIVASIVPIVPRVASGVWGMPTDGNYDLVNALNADSDSRAYRVLWLGSGDALPGAARQIDDDVASSITQAESGLLSLTLPTADKKGQDGIETAVRSLRRGETVAVGRMLAPYGVRFVAIPTQTGRTKTSSKKLVVPDSLVEAFDHQIDMRNVTPDASVIVFENTQYIPVRARLTDAGVLASHGSASALQTSNLAGATPVLRQTSRFSWSGQMEAGTLYVSQERSSGWYAYQGGKALPRSTGFEWATTFEVPKSGHVELRYMMPNWILAVQVINAVLWLFILLVALRHFSANGRWS